MVSPEQSDRGTRCRFQMRFENVNGTREATIHWQAGNPLAALMCEHPGKSHNPEFEPTTNT